MANAGNGCNHPGPAPFARATNSGPNPNVTVSLAGATPSSGSESASGGTPWVKRAASARARSTPTMRSPPRPRVVSEVEADEHGVRLRVRVDPGLVGAVERHRLVAVERHRHRRAAIRVRA